MLQYDTGRWAVGFVFQLRGSVVPKALVWALPSAILSLVVHFLLHEERFGMRGNLQELLGDNLNTSQVWTGYNFLIAFLLTFRTGQAYSRWWEGGTLLQQARGEWINAFSNLVAFSVESRRDKESIRNFQRLLATLMSHLSCAALNTVARLEDRFEVLNIAPLSEEGIKFLVANADKVEIVLQWVERLVLEGMTTGLLPIPAPIMSRVFQELSRGRVHINNVRKISEFMFPFPYSQLSTLMLLLHSIMAPIVTGILLEKWYWSFLISFLSVFAFWSLNYVAVEIECPFGDDANDLPMHQLQESFNRMLMMLLEEEAQIVPRGSMDEFRRAMHKQSLKVKDFVGTDVRGSSIMEDRDFAEHVFTGTQTCGPRPLGVLSPPQSPRQSLSSANPGEPVARSGSAGAGAIVVPLSELIELSTIREAVDEWQHGSWSTQGEQEEHGELANTKMPLPAGASCGGRSWRGKPVPRLAAGGAGHRPGGADGEFSPGAVQIQRPATGPSELRPAGAVSPDPRLEPQPEEAGASGPGRAAGRPRLAALVGKQPDAGRER